LREYRQEYGGGDEHGRHSTRGRRKYAGRLVVLLLRLPIINGCTAWFSYAWLRRMTGAHRHRQGSAGAGNRHETRGHSGPDHQAGQHQQRQQDAH